jgi:hypothetical protein
VGLDGVEGEGEGEENIPIEFVKRSPIFLKEHLQKLLPNN